MAAARKLKADGKKITAKALADHVAGGVNVSAVELDALIAFIEKLLPVILQLIALFSKK
jgi:hypothetical protein